MMRHNNRFVKLTNRNKTEHGTPCGEIKGKKKDPPMSPSCSFAISPMNELQKSTGNKARKKKKKNSNKQGQARNDPNHGDRYESNPSRNNQDGTGDDSVVASKKGEDTVDQTLLPNDVVPIKSLHKETILNYEGEEVPHNNETLRRGSNSAEKLHVLDRQGNHTSRSLNGMTSLRSMACSDRSGRNGQKGPHSNGGDEVIMPHSTTKKVIVEGGVKIVKSEVRDVGAENESGAPEGGELNQSKLCQMDSPKLCQMDSPKLCELDSPNLCESDPTKASAWDPPKPNEASMKSTSGKRKKKKKKIKSKLFRKSVLYSNYSGPDILTALNQTKLNLSFYQREVDDFLSVIRNLQNIVLIEREKYTELKEMLKYTTEEIEKENARLYQEIHSYKEKYNKLRRVISNIGYGILFNLHNREMSTCTNRDNIDLEAVNGDERHEEYSAQVNEYEYDYVMVNETLCSANGGSGKGKCAKRGRSGNTSSLLKYLDF
ncbi:hypothetical protein C922_03212 [Plasmodium inui San Antonio 1]|uniref:Uncharacterized protein n=1 Tax=Plasmodium inui San Antonio 1 TaxID=1237626 RepID=W7ALU3_9APIC|nr:hypothetical protein C922_03212 [Plasmodium inui San Antonio 1]EUD66296.1 hypothetical protein C922_03212 [Plasmodium inui San Antonio 1]